MATVVRAVNSHGTAVALKISHAANERYYGDALIAETEILQKLEHPGIVKILPNHTEAGKMRYMERAMELNGHPWFFAMEYLEGGSLRDYLRKVGVITFGEAAAIACNLSLTLQYVHSKAYVHNNINLNNILFRHKLEKDGVFEPVLIDFGIAARTRHIHHDAGSFQWMSPERLLLVRKEFAPEIQVDATKADIYAIGVLLYRMFTTKMPFARMNESGYAQPILNNKTPERVTTLNSKIPSSLDELIISCLAKRPEARPTIPQLIEGLSVYSDDRIATLPMFRNLFSWLK